MTAFLTPLDLDIRWESTGAGELPYPLVARSHGATLDERAALRRQVLGTPTEPWLADWLTVLATAERTVDAVLPVDAGGPTAAIAAARGDQALLATQNADGLWLRPIDPVSLVSAVVGLLPAERRGSERSITLTADDLAAGGRTDLDRRTLTAFADQHTRRAGQLAVTVRKPLGGRTRAPVLSWFDTDTGRYLTYTKRAPDGRDWVTIAPADPATLRQRLTEQLVTITGAVG